MHWFDQTRQLPYQSCFSRQVRAAVCFVLLDRMQSCFVQENGFCLGVILCISDLQSLFKLKNHRIDNYVLLVSGVMYSALQCNLIFICWELWQQLRKIIARVILVYRVNVMIMIDCYVLLQLRDLRAIGWKFFHVLYPKQSKLLLKDCKHCMFVFVFHCTVESFFGRFLN